VVLACDVVQFLERIVGQLKASASNVNVECRMTKEPAKTVAYATLIGPKPSPYRLFQICILVRIRRRAATEKA
jgi:hypothetical protein